MQCRFVSPYHWQHVDFYLDIDASEETIVKLLDEYRKEDKKYNRVGWIQFLRNKGIKVEDIRFALFDF